VFLKNRLCQFGLLVSLSIAAPLWGQNTITLQSCPGSVAPGGNAICQVFLNLQGAATVDSLTFAVSVTANSPAPAPTANMKFKDFTADGSGSAPGATPTAIAPLWVGMNPALTGSSEIATIQFTAPSTASGGSYTLQFTNVSANVGGLGTAAVPVSLGSSVTIPVATVLTISAPAAAALTPQATAGSPYTNSSFAVSGGTAPFTWTATGLPTGLSMSSAGVISGTPAAAGTSSSINVTVKDSESPAVSATGLSPYSLVVNAALSALAPTKLPVGTANSAYSQAISVTGGTGPYTWTVTGLPAGVTPTTSTTNSITISGTPTGAATASVKVTVTDANTATSSTTYTLTISGPLSLAPASGPLPPGTVGTAYTTGTTLAAGGGTAPYTYSITGGTLPGGLSISATTGVISGTPTTAGSFTGIQVTVKDSANGTAAQTYSILVNPAIVVTTVPTSLPNGTTGAPYPTPPATFTASATGGSGTYTWSISGLPGVTIGATTGIVSGTPTTAATDTVTITATDANSATGTATFKNVVIATGVSISTPATGTALGATAGNAYSVTVTAQNGTGPYTWTQTGLPTGLSLSNSTGLTATISGTPATAAAATNVAVTVKDSTGSANTATYPLTVNAVPSLATGTLPVATVGSAFTSGTVIALTGGTAPITWTTNPALPSGLSINSSGVITGTPAKGTNSATPYSIGVTATDANRVAASQTYSLTVNPALAVSPATLPSGIPGVVYTKTTLTPSGGSGTGYTFTSTGLPAGLGLTSAGVLSGTPTATDAQKNYAVVVTLMDSIGTTANFNYTLLLAPPLVITGTPLSLPAGTVNAAYNSAAATVTATGGTPPYTWSATGLPAGLSMGTVGGAGVISGSPTAVGSFSVTVSVKDANSTITSAPATIVISALPLQIITGLLPPGVVNTPYTTTTIFGQGGVLPYSWSITGLPAGLSANGATISGTPTTATGSPFKVVVAVTDATLTTTTRTFSLAINGALTVASPTTLPAASLNTAYTPVTATASGGLPPYTWTATGFPAGMSVNIANGAISGTPTTAAGSPYTVVLTVEDSTGKTASMNYTLTVNSAALTISGPASLPTGTAGSAYTATTVTASGGSGVYTFTATGLPSGLSISSAGVISGTPATTTAGPYTVVVTVTDSSSNTATKSYSLTINAPVSTLPVISSVSASTEGQSFIAPNTWLSVYGTNFEPANFQDTWTNAIKASSTGALPTTLDALSVMVGGVPAYVAYVSATQVNVLTGNIGFGPLQVTVTTAAGTSNAVSITSQQAIPGFFEWPNTQPVATHEDYSDAAANGTFAGQTTIPAAPGETIILWGSGFGPTTPANPFGVAVPATPTYETASNVTVTLNNAPLVVYQNLAFLTAGNAGLFQLGVTLPATLANGSYPLTVSIGGVTSPPLMLTVAAPGN
jgi:uncharacterized protein (TIGR03437 family)